MSRVIIHTDGACSGNPGPGGYGAVLTSGERRKEISAGYRLTTNNRMEILAAVEALNCLKKSCDVTLYSDSQYLVNAVEKGWLEGWKGRNWRRASGALKNADLWKLLDVALKRHRVSFRWTKGHAGAPENERCDFLATQAVKNRDLQVDEGFRPEDGEA